MRKIFIFVVLLTFFSCNKKEKKKNEENSVQEVVKDTVPVKKVTDQVKKSPELVFTVQIAALEKVNPALENLPNLQVVKENGLNKYRLQSFKSYIEARNYRRTIWSQYEDAFIQALKNGTPIHIKEALKESTE